MRRTALAAAAAAVSATAFGVGAETLECAPMFPRYCANIHVGCAGRSDVPTATFLLRLEDGYAEVRPEGAAPWRAPYAASHSGRVARRGMGWLRVDPDLRFSERIYVDGQALMSAGACAASQ